MKRMQRTIRLGLAWVAGGVGGLLRAADPAAAAGATVELPPMMVEESVSSVPWLYVNAGGTEFLSRCSASTTRSLVEAWLTQLQLVRALIPDEFLARLEVPTVFVLYAQDLQQTVSAEIQRELQAEEDRRRGRGAAAGGGVNIAPSMRLADRDMHASIAYIDEALFDAATLSVSSGHVRYLLNGRVPELPAWLTDGLERVYRGADLVMDPITLRPLVWVNDTESRALASDASRPRAVLPGTDLFASDAARLGESRHPRRLAARASTQELFVRWALVSGKPMRDALWRWATRAAEGPVTEEMFATTFGFGYSELRDRLSDYLPKAVTQTVRIHADVRPEPIRFEVERATPNEVARVRGEWERLAISHVQRRLPQVREPYIVQARRTLRRAFDAGDRDPRLLATLGLCEIDAGNPAGAREHLEQAVALGVVRPRAYYELARLRFDELQRRSPDAKTFAFADVAPVLDALQRGLKQSPPLPEAVELLGDVWARCELAPNASEVAALERGGALFPRRPAVGIAVARALTRHGRPTEAAVVLDRLAGAALEPPMREAVARLWTELPSGRSQGPGAGLRSQESGAGSQEESGRRAGRVQP